jgi:hypothetical protein
MPLYTPLYLFSLMFAKKVNPNPIYQENIIQKPLHNHYIYTVCELHVLATESHQQVHFICYFINTEAESQKSQTYMEWYIQHNAPDDGYL